MNILALDTASHVTGYAIYKDGVITESGAIKLRGNGNTDTERTQNRLEQLYVKVCNLISKHKITQLVAEDIFNDSNPQKKSACEVLGACRGILIASNAQYKLQLIKFIKPCVAKREMWGYTTARADHRTMTRQEQKARMCRAVERLGYQLKTDRNGNKDNDQADAIGILITYLNAHNLPVTHPKIK